MSTSARSIYTSAPFKFIIDGDPLYIHAELISRNSKPLDRMINGYMSEAQKGFAVIKDVDEGTFVRFIQWAYNGYYEAGECKINSPRADPAWLEEKMAGEPDLEELASAPSPAPEVPYPAEPYDDAPAGQRLRELFINRKPKVRQQAISTCPPRPNQASNEDYTEVFLSHARVYVFAEKYDIQLLKALALDELHGTLQNFYLYPERTGDIIDLLRYAYANTGEPVHGVEDMRTVLTQYVGFEMDTLIQNNDFRDLLIEDGGPLLGDFLKMVGKRL